MTTKTTQAHIPSSKSERNLIMLQVNINIIKNKLKELKLLIHDTHAYIFTIQESNLTPNAKTSKVHNLTTVRTDRLHKAGGGLITLIRDNITFTTTDIPSTINTHNIEHQMIKVLINNTKHITIANIYIQFAICLGVVATSLFNVMCLVWVEVPCLIDHVWSSKECACCACDPSVHQSVPSIGLVYVSYIGSYLLI